MSRRVLAPRVGGLEVYFRQASTDHGQASSEWTRFEQLDIEWKVLDSVLDISLGIHETAAGRTALANLGVQIVQEQRPDTVTSYGSRNINEMEHHVNRFLDIIRRDFPCVYVSAAIGGEAMASRFTWGSDVDDYEPKQAATVSVKPWLLQGVINSHGSQEDPRRANNFKFYLVIALAHEIVHLFVGYLTGQRGIGTPRKVTAGGHGSTRTGESGRYWESTFLGGFPEMWFHRGSRDLMDGGELYLLLPSSRGIRMSQMISSTYINEIVQRRFSFPVQLSSMENEVPRSELENQYSSTPSRAALNNAQAAVPRITRSGREGYRFRGPSEAQDPYNSPPSNDRYYY